MAIDGKTPFIYCALTKVFQNMFEGDQYFDSNGWLVLGFNGRQPEMAGSLLLQEDKTPLVRMGC